MSISSSYKHFYVFLFSDATLQSFSLESSATTISGTFELADPCGLVARITVEAGKRLKTISAEDRQFELTGLTPCTDFEVILQFQDEDDNVLVTQTRQISTMPSGELFYN